jgi:hypothetical protein
MGFWRWAGVIGLLLALGCQPDPAARHQQASAPASASVPGATSRPFGWRDLSSRPLPSHLSETGLFDDTAAMRPAAGLLAYDVNVSFWSDGAEKRRWMALPAGGHVGFSATGEWVFPPGTIFVKQFQQAARAPGAAQDGDPRARLETRVLVCDARSEVHGASYRWRAGGLDADIVLAPTMAHVSSSEANRSWYFPGPQDCRTCHTPAAGGVLGVKTRQLNRPGGARGENQLVAWQRAGVFTADLPPLRPDDLPRLASADDTSRNLTDRARSYLDANCANCHRPGGAAGQFDARYDVPLDRQNLVAGPVMIDLGLDHAKVFAAGDVWRSVALVRVETFDQTRMPPLGHLTVDHRGAELLRAWIASLSARPVLAPPTISPKGGEFAKAPLVTLHDPDSAATIHFTLDGSRPALSSPVYSAPIKIAEPTTLRAKAYKDGATPSIIVQETFVVGE